MKVRFEKPPFDDCFIITAEDAEEATKLEQWNNCIASAEFHYDCTAKRPCSELTLVKEI